jgi:hypothetical protein
MADTASRIQTAVSDLAENEALFSMLDEDAASEMLKWGVNLANSVVKQSDGLDDLAADLAIQPRLKALRSLMRSVGNWAAGKYVQPESRIQLRDKLLDQFKVMLGEDSPLPTAEKLDGLLNQAGDASNTPRQLIAKLMQLVTDHQKGEL